METEVEHLVNSTNVNNDDTNINNNNNTSHINSNSNNNIKNNDEESCNIATHRHTRGGSVDTNFFNVAGASTNEVLMVILGEIRGMRDRLTAIEHIQGISNSYQDNPSSSSSKRSSKLGKKEFQQQRFEDNKKSEEIKKLTEQVDYWKGVAASLAPFKAQSKKYEKLEIDKKLLEDERRIFESEKQNFKQSVDTLIRIEEGKIDKAELEESARNAHAFDELRGAFQKVSEELEISQKERKAQENTLQDLQTYVSQQNSIFEEKQKKINLIYQALQTQRKELEESRTELENERNRATETENQTNTAFEDLRMAYLELQKANESLILRWQEDAKSLETEAANWKEESEKYKKKIDNYKTRIEELQIELENIKTSGKNDSSDSRKAMWVDGVRDNKTRDALNRVADLEKDVAEWRQNYFQVVEEKTHVEHMLKDAQIKIDVLESEHSPKQTSDSPIVTRTRSHSLEGDNEAAQASINLDAVNFEFLNFRSRSNDIISPPPKPTPNLDPNQNDTTSQSPENKTPTPTQISQTATPPRSLTSSGNNTPSVDEARVSVNVNRLSASLDLLNRLNSITFGEDLTSSTNSTSSEDEWKAGTRALKTPLRFIKPALELGKQKKSVNVVQDEHTKKVVLVQAQIRRYLAKKGYQRIYRRAAIVREILSTEKAYVKGLDLVMKLFLDPLRSKAFSKEEVVSMETIEVIFSSLELIHRSNAHILKEFSPIVKHWHYESLIGKVFEGMLPMLEPHIDFIVNFENSRNAIRKNLKENPAFLKFINTTQQAPELKYKEISDLLITPVQRIPRYVMLIRDLFTHTLPSHPDYENIRLAFAKVKAFADFVNERKRARERLVHLRESVVGLKESLETPTRLFIREGPLRYKKSENHCFLFNDLFLICRPETKRRTSLGLASTEEIYNTVTGKTLEQIKFKLITKVEIGSRTRIDDHPDTKAQMNTFSIVAYDNTVLLEAPTPQIKSIWVLELQKLCLPVL